MRELVAVAAVAFECGFAGPEKSVSVHEFAGVGAAAAGNIESETVVGCAELDSAEPFGIGNTEPR